MVCSVGGLSNHLYADDTVLYAAAPSPGGVLASLQDNFHRVQQALSVLNLLLNTIKTKVMWFSKKGSVPHKKSLLLSKQF